jgi:hypothetical protein
MKSKTLNLIRKYHLLIEQDEQNPEVDPSQQEGMPSEGGDVTEMPSEPQETIPLSSPAELRYIQDVVLAALMMNRPSGEDRIKLENLRDLLDDPDAMGKINQTGQTARDLYQTEILPIIRPAHEGEDIRNISDQIS